jgi:serine/threonine protein kinase
MVFAVGIDKKGMSKQNRNLRLVQAEKAESPGFRSAAGFEFISLAELSASEQKTVKSLVEKALPNSGIIAVVKTARDWDLRPVVASASESSPSVIRMLGNQLNSRKDLEKKIKNNFEKIKSQANLPSELKEWGEHMGQLYYRRSLVSDTLAHLLTPGSENSIENWRLSEVLDLIKNLTKLVKHFHSQGILHGHLSTSNIYLQGNGKISLLDVGVAAATVLARVEKVDYDSSSSIAPELLSNSELTAATDIFGLGSVIKRLLVKSQNKLLDSSEDLAQHKKEIEAISSIVKQMMAENPSERPELGEVLEVVLGNKVSGKKLKNNSKEEQKVTVDKEIANKKQVLTVQFQEDKELEFRAEEEAILSLRKKNSSVFFYLGLLSVLFAFWFYMGKANKVEEMTFEQMSVSWRSNVPSKMVSVANLAVEKGGLAEELILSSIRRGEVSVPGVNSRLIKIAFDPRWEAQLSDKDRELALALGLAGFVGADFAKKIGSEIKSLEQFHPGVLLAITAFGNERINKFLEKIPTKVLGQGGLPSPLGTAFSKMFESDNNSKLSSRDVQLLAKFGTIGADQKSELVEFLRKDPGYKLQALAMLASSNLDFSKYILEILVNHPNLTFDSPQVAWGREWKITSSWEELEVVDQLMILSGNVPSSSLQVLPQNIGKMFNHPSSKIRKYAVDKALDSISFAHPGSGEALLEISANPETLNAQQLFLLARFLENPEKIDETKAKEWFLTNPSVELISKLLLSSWKQTKATRFDTLSAIYLKQKNWKPELDSLEKLMLHPDLYARLFAYNQIYTNLKSEVAIELLNQAYLKEAHLPYKTNLEEMIAQLSEKQ